MIGATLSHYRVTAALGAGGMGEVYRATDTNLGRDVAIKVLPPEVAGDAERLARFRREAHLLAALNHPNIAAIHGLEEVDGTPFLVLELVEGEDLKQRLDAGPVPVDETLEIASQIAEALEEAHSRGIVHRDLKPANVKVTRDGKVKVLDFGLARAYAVDPMAGSAPDLSHSPTLSHTGTRAGVILGTAAYMSPEQARGKPLDKRADIWAFGVVLFEMLSGRRLFEGETVGDVLAGVLKTDPDWTTLPPTTPPAVRELLRRCLARDPKRRLRDAGDARLVLEDVTGGAWEGEAAAPVESSPSGHERRWMALAVLMTVLTAGLGARLLWSPRQTRDAAAALRATIPLPEGLQLDGVGPPAVALSRDGRSVAFVARGATGVQQIYVRPLDKSEATLIPGSETGEGPFFSPDGRWVAFAVGVSMIANVPPELRKYSLDTGLTQTICRVPDYFGGAWTDDDTLLFVGAQPRGLWTVDAGGGSARPRVERFREDGRDAPKAVAWPELLPGGHSVVVDDWETGGIVTVDLDSREVKDLDLAGYGARFLPTGHLAYVGRDGTLLAVPFDARALRVTGTPVALASGVAIARNWSPAFAVSGNGTLAYARGYLPNSFREPRRLIRGHRDGTLSPTSVEADLYGRRLDISPDGRTLALTTWDEALWLADLLRGTRAKLPSPGMIDILDLRWTPDGTGLVVCAALRGESGFGLFSVAADGTGDPETLLPPGPDEIDIAGWSQDSRTLYYFTRAQDSTLMALEDGAASRAVFEEPGSVVMGRVSPDGRLVAFESGSGSDFQVYVRPLDGSGGRITVTSGGGRGPAWSPDGRELLFTRQGRVLVVSVERTADGLHFGPEGTRVEWDADPRFVVAPDGSLYGLEPVPGAALQTSLELQTGWFDEVQRLTGASAAESRP